MLNRRPALLEQGVPSDPKGGSLSGETVFSGCVNPRGFHSRLGDGDARGVTRMCSGLVLRGPRAAKDFGGHESTLDPGLLLLQPLLMKRPCVSRVREQISTK